MSPTTPKPEHRTIAWLDPEQVDLVRAIGDVAGLKFVAAGTHSRGRSAEVALALATAPIDDLRAALAAATNEGPEGVDLVLIAAPHDFATDLSDDTGADLEAIESCRDRGVGIVTLEPIPGSVLAFSTPTAGSPEMSGGGEAPDGQARPLFVPRFRASRRARELAEVLPDFGPVRVLQVESVARPGEGSLGSRLFDAMDTVRWIMGDPESAHAVFVQPPGGERQSPRDLPTDTVRSLHGTLLVNLRFADARAAQVMASDAGAIWSRTVTLLGDRSKPETGSLRVGEDVFQWVGADGATLDTSKVAKRRTGKAATASPHRACAESVGLQIKELLSARMPGVPPVDYPRVLAAAGTALLSARTGQAESVASVLRMMGRSVG